MKTEIPIAYLGDLKLDNTPPTVIELTKGQDAVDKLTTAIAAVKPAPSMFELSQAAKARGVTIDEVLETPALCVHWSREEWEKSLRGSELDALASRLAVLLDDETNEIGTRNQLAQILLRLGDRRGFDWNLKRLKNSDPADFSGAGGNLLLMYLAGLEHREWLAGIDLWRWIEPRLDSPQNYEDVGRELCPGEMSEWYIRQLKRTDLPDSKRRSYLATLAGFAPSVEALDACADLFVKPGPDSEWSESRRYADIFTQFASGGDIFRCSRPKTLLRDWFEANPLSAETLAAIRARVCDYSSRLTGDKHWISGEYHKVICAFGGEEWRDYFEKCLEVSNTQHHAFEALARLAGDDRMHYLRRHAAGFDGQPRQLQSQAIRMSCAELAGTKDPRLTQLLTKLFRESPKERELRIRQLYFIGSTDVGSELLAEFRASQPQSPQPDVQQLLPVLSAAGFGKELTIEDVNRRILPEKPTEDMPDKVFINPNHQVRVALELAGLRSEVGMIETVEQQLAAFSKIARGGFDVDLVHIDVRVNAVFFRHHDCVLKYEVPYPEEYQYPLVESAIANAVLKHFGVANRFVAYGDCEGMNEIYFYYGPHKLAKTLETDFGVKFIPGWEGSF